MDFGKQIEEHELPTNAERNQQVVIHEEANMNDESTMPKTPRNKTEHMNDATSSSPDFSNLITDVGDNTYIRRPHPLKVQLSPRNHRLRTSDIIREK